MSSKNNTPKPGPPRRASKAPDPQSQPRATPGTVPGPRNAQAFPDFKPFHSAVNRIPVLRTRSTNEAASGILSPDLFADSPALGHDHLRPDRWSGSIDVEMTVRTPLVFGAQTKHDGKTYVNVPVDDAGNPVIAPTMVKGMISRAYEALTCSRFRVFGDAENRSGARRSPDDRSRRLTYRGDAASALRLVPIRVKGEDGDGLVGELFYGDTQDRRSFKKGRYNYPVMPAAALQTGSEGHAYLKVDNKTLEKKLAPHGRRIRCHLTLCLHGDQGKGPRYAYWQVTHIQVGSDFVEVAEIKRSVTKVDKMEDVSGYVCQTAPPWTKPGNLFPRKHDERFFFDVSSGGATEVRIDPHVREGYRAVVESYVSHRENESGKQRHTSNRATYTAQQARNESLKAETAASLKVEDVAFAVVEEIDGKPVVREIVPTMIGRHAYAMSPHALAEKQGVLPVSLAEEASTADRLFGYVVPAAAEGATGGDVAARGRIVVGPVDSTGALVSTKEKQLAPLLSPKPSSARRFLTDEDGRTPKETDEKPLRRDQYFTDGQLLGAAAYPVHRRLLEGEDLDSDGFPKQATTAASLGGQQQSNDSVRLTAKSWLKAGSVLRCTVSFTNLSRDELGALVWVLTPENLVPPEKRTTGEGTQSPVGYLRMGLGKPLGLGTIEVRIADGGLRAVCGDDLAGLYARLDGCLGQEMRTYPLSHFPLPNEDTLREEPWVRALQRAAFGYTVKHPVRYMSLDENKENNQTQTEPKKSGEPELGRGLAPTDLCVADPPEPIDMGSAPQRGQQGNHHKRR
ncbi:TIGR03986 family CRISPR-associated RAMP protein [Actinomyces trachealis]|uniref:TIGR03986 family type III CRISPR-associated RAMP protein n=1 Tax=Actinomyces trachealis TaxID=2763540 RepID=UPI0018928948|nr:TIGR03986 family CRISPR-associated RAMP protein [Actinomyces trachealis]